MTNTQGTNVAAGGLTGFPNGAGIGASGAGGGTGARTLPMTPVQRVMTQQENAGVPQGRPTGGTGFQEHTYLHTYIHTYIHIHTCIHTNMHTHIRTYIQTYIHTYIHS